MNVVGLFAGIGGFEHGLARTGHRTILTCESWAPARAVLAARLGGVPNHDDVRTLPDLPAGTELLCGGFPCQDLSQAGRTAGIDGLRSGLVGEVFRLLDRRRVPWVVLENVSFMLHLDGGRAMERLVGALEERGYRWAYRVVNSLAFLPQRRQRVFIVASTVADPAHVLLAENREAPESPTRLDTHAHGFYWTEGIRGLGWAPDSVPTLKNGSTLGIPSPPAILLPDGTIIQPDLRDAERLQGFAEDWTAPAAEIARPSLRWSLVGNAVTVPVVEWLGSRLNDPPEHDPVDDRPLPAGGRWPQAARFDGRHRHAVAVGGFPVWRHRQPLHRFLRYPGRPLSERATAGFLARAETSSLRLITEEFKALVRGHLALVRGERSLDPIAAE
ncbi:MAG TPA: DNA (cytosine-5-)-methyltransferase [Geminicoccus sp.]|nr:DNA (cytosine-5-)-methyltransferase [Geminicoccus sp.]